MGEYEEKLKENYLITEQNIIDFEKLKEDRILSYSNKNKRKPLSVYLRCKYGNIINFLDLYSFYGIINKNANIQVKLIDSEINLNYKNNNNIFDDYKEWILLDEEDFILI